MPQVRIASHPRHPGIVRCCSFSKPARSRNLHEGASCAVRTLHQVLHELRVSLAMVPLRHQRQWYALLSNKNFFTVLLQLLRRQSTSQTERSRSVQRLTVAARTTSVLVPMCISLVHQLQTHVPSRKKLASNFFARPRAFSSGRYNTQSPKIGNSRLCCLPRDLSYAVLPSPPTANNFTIAAECMISHGIAT